MQRFLLLERVVKRERERDSHLSDNVTARLLFNLGTPLQKSLFYVSAFAFGTMTVMRALDRKENVASNFQLSFLCQMHNPGVTVARKCLLS